jgi:hypothetical protein
MILDVRQDALALTCRYTIHDAMTGESLDNNLIFYADSDRGFYRCYLKDQTGNPYLWDRRIKQPPIPQTPQKYIEMAWEQVNRPIAIFLREGGNDNKS